MLAIVFTTLRGDKNPTLHLHDGVSGLTLIIPALAKQGGNRIENIDLTLLRHISACTRRTDFYIFRILSHLYVSIAAPRIFLL